MNQFPKGGTNMITIEQRVSIQEDRELRLTLPPQVPVGEADIVVMVNPEKSSSQSGQSLWDFYGVLADSPNFKDDPVEIQRRLRDEWNDRLSA